MNVLISGANGFIARYLSSALKFKGYFVRGIDIFQHVSGKYDQFFVVDITQPIEKNRALIEACQDIDVIFHLAGKTDSIAKNQKDADEYMTVNVEGTRNLLQAASHCKVKKFIFFSTVKVYGEDVSDINDRVGIIDETILPSPDSPYGRSKFDAEKIVLNGRYVDCPVVLRLSMVYGPGSKGNIVHMIKAIKRGLILPFPEFGNKRSMVDVRDVANAAVLVSENEKACSNVYIISDSKTYSTRQIIEIVSKALNRHVAKFHIPKFIFYFVAKLGDMIGKISKRSFFLNSKVLNKIAGSAWFSSEKFEKNFNFVPEYDLGKSIPDMIKELYKKE